MACCEHWWQGFYSAEEWERSRRFDSDYYKPVEGGDVDLVRCPVKHGFHLVPRDGGRWRTGYQHGEKIDAPV